jgi:hypothetical protein
MSDFASPHTLRSGSAAWQGMLGNGERVKTHQHRFGQRVYPASGLLVTHQRPGRVSRRGRPPARGRRRRARPAPVSPQAWGRMRPSAPPVDRRDHPCWPVPRTDVPEVSYAHARLEHPSRDARCRHRQSRCFTDTDLISLREPRVDADVRLLQGDSRHMGPPVLSRGQWGREVRYDFYAAANRLSNASAAGPEDAGFCPVISRPSLTTWTPPSSPLE